MTERTFRVFQWSYMLIVVLAASVVGALFPAVPTWAFLAAGLVLGALLLFLAVRILKRNDLVLKDERTRRNSERAAFLAYRIFVWASIAAIVVLDCVPGLGRGRLVVSRTLIAVLVFQYVFFMAFYFFLNRRDAS